MALMGHRSWKRLDNRCAQVKASPLALEHSCGGRYALMHEEDGIPGYICPQRWGLMLSQCSGYVLRMMHQHWWPICTWSSHVQNPNHIQI